MHIGSHRGEGIFLPSLPILRRIAFAVDSIVDMHGGKESQEIAVVPEAKMCSYGIGGDGSIGAFDDILQ